MINNVAYPLTTETLSQMLASPDAFQGVSQAPMGQNLSIFGLTDNSMINNYGGDSREGTSFSERPAIKLASFMEKVSNVKQSDVDNIMDYLDKHPEVVNQFHTSGTYEVIEKLAELKTNSAETLAQNVLRGMDVDRHMVYEDERGNTFIKQANSKVDHVWDVPVNKADILSMEKYATAKHPESAEKSRTYSNSYKVINDSSTILITEDQDWAIFDKHAELNSIPTVETMDHALATQTPVIGSYGIFKIGNEVTAPGEIIDISKVEESSPTNAYNVIGRNETLYVTESGDYETKEASFDSDKVFSTFDLEGDEPMLGQTGTFVIGENAINPFEVVSLQKVAGVGNYEVVGYDGLRKISYYPIKMQSKEAIPHETIKNAYYIPGNAKYKKLSGGKMHRGVANNIEKTANFSKVKMVVKTDVGEINTYYPTASKASEITPHLYEKNAHYLPESVHFIPLHDKLDIDYSQQFEKVSNYVTKDSAGLYNFSGDDFEKYASNGHAIRNLSKLDAMWTAIHCNASDIEIEKVSSLANGEVVGLRSNIAAPQNTKDIGNEIENRFEKLSADIPTLNEFLVKEASVLEDKTTVDAVLSLGLLNKENLMDYIQLAPNLEKTASDLAKTLLTVRMGLSHIPEEPVKTAMHSLARVGRVLRELETIVSDTK